MYKLMIVEDEGIIRRGLVNSIDWSNMGFSVVSDAEDGKKALRLLKDNIPDVILTDIRMPIMDGLKLMSEVSDQYPQIKLVVLSGYGDFFYAQHAIQCGALGYILKPTKDEDIKRVFYRVKLVLDGIASAAVISELPKTRFLDPVIQRVEKYISENFHEKITLNDVAKIAYMNPTYFSTYFKQKTGSSFRDYLTRIRMDKAKELALTTDLKGYYISVMVGYDDYRHFSKLFREIHGASIAEMRKESRG